MSYQALSLEEQFDTIQANIATSKGITALGACIFAGGFSFGMEQAGLDVVGHLELPDADLGTNSCKTRWPVAVAPLTEEYPHGSASDKAMGLTLMKFVDRLVVDGTTPDIFYANPPCVAFAGTGKHLGATDARMCFIRYCIYEMAWKLKPKIWMWELVPPVFTKGRAFLDAMAFRAKREGYRCYGFLTTSAIHGGYQDRRRFHFIASRYELDFEGVYELEPDDRKGSRTLGQLLDILSQERLKAWDKNIHGELKPQDQQWGPMDVLGNDKNVYKGAFRDIMPFCPPGSHLRDVQDHLMYEYYRPHKTAWSGTGRPGFAHTRARLDRPSPNVLGGHTILHPVENRYLTPRECATVMGFPTDYPFSRGTKAYAEIGKGLCTHNAAFLGRVARCAIERDIRTVPRVSSEKEFGYSYMQSVDWRNRGKKLSLKMNEADRREWFAHQHPELDFDKATPKEENIVDGLNTEVA